MSLPAAIQRVARAFLLAVWVMGVAAGYWGVVAAPDLLARPDNARALLLERRYPRGPLLDRNLTPLAQAQGAPGQAVRVYAYPDLSSSLGHVSLAYGQSGLEAALASTLTGQARLTEAERWRHALLSTAPAGVPVRLTLDLPTQRRADAALGAHPGAVVVLEATTGDLWALVSHPTYNANTLETDWARLMSDPGAPMLNRAVSARYQPGGLMYVLTLAAALNAQHATPADLVTDANAHIGVGGWQLACQERTAPARQTLAQALQAGCPWPFAELGNELGATLLTALWHDMRLFTPLPVGLPQPAWRTPHPFDAAFEAIGQGQTTVSPVQVALITASVAQRGQQPAPRLADAWQTPTGAWQVFEPAETSIASLPPDVAETLAGLLAGGYRASALTNAQGQALAWFTAFTPNRRFVVTVLLENATLDAAEAIGREVLAGMER